MDSIDPQPQDTSPISNGVAEPATLSLPASPPQALTPALSDPPRTAEQGKDGERTSFRFPLVVLLRTSHQVLLHLTRRLRVPAPLPKSLTRSTSTRNSWKRIAPLPEQARYLPLRRLRRSRAQRVSPQVCIDNYVFANEWFSQVSPTLSPLTLSPRHDQAYKVAVVLHEYRPWVDPSVVNHAIPCTFARIRHGVCCRPPSRTRPYLSWSTTASTCRQSNSAAASWSYPSPFTPQG